MHIFYIVHNDVKGLTHLVSRAHYKYFVTFIDVYSRFTWVYFFHAKSEIFLPYRFSLLSLTTNFPRPSRSYDLF